MVKITRLPSGSYRARVHLGGGKYKSITGKDKKDVQLKAAQIEAEVEQKIEDENKHLTLAEAMKSYCEIKRNVISPTSYREYLRKAETAFPVLRDLMLDELTQANIQSAINSAAAELSPKSVRDLHGFLSAVLKQYRPDFVLHTTLPQPAPSNIQIPSSETVAKLIEAAEDTPMELPIILAALCGMRKSEILGLKWQDINFDTNTMRISEARVIDSKGELVSKGTKTVAGTRTIRLLPQVREALLKLKKDSGYVIELTPAGLSRRYQTLQKYACPGEHYRFHDLRHYAISVMLSLNIPKKYIADYVGHENENMIDQVYGHIMRERKNEVEDILADYYSKHLLKKSDTKSDTK